MEKQNLLVDCNANAIADRLQKTLENLHVQKGQAFWDDIEKIEHCIEALRIVAKENEIVAKENEIVAKENEMLLNELEEQGVLREVLKNYR